ncbi:uncharacterized protein LOC134966638 isoform X2 [Pseudophryne corroboree]
MTIAFSNLGKTCQKLGICSEIGFLHKLMRFSKTEEDPELFMKNLQFEGVPVRVYQPRSPSVGDRKGVMFFHGGGFVFGSIDSHDKHCRYIAKTSGAVVVSVGYRLAPEHRYPAAFDDCLSATTHFLKTAHEHGVDSSSIIICGDSAGGNLTAAVCQALVSRTDLPKPLAQVLIYPAVQMVDYNLPSYQQNSMVPLLLRERTVFYKLHYLGCFCDDLCKEVLLGSHVPPEMRRKLSKWLSIDNIPKEFTAKGYKTHNMAAFKNNVYEKVKRVFEPHFSPLLAEESVIRLLPKAYILTCEFDVLRDDGLLYKRRLEDNGIPVTWYHVKDGFHGVVSFFDGPNCSSGKLALDNAKTFLKLGICSEFGFLRPLMRFSRTAEDPELYMKNLQFEGVPVRVYQPRSPSVGNRKGVMFFHGGGFIFGSIDSYDNHCRYIAKTSGAVVVSVGYRLVPEHRYPAAFDDCLSATIHLFKTAQEHGVDSCSIVICGDSAGGNLAAAVCQTLVSRTDLPKPLAQVLIYPVVQMIDCHLPSYQQNGMVPPLLTEITVFGILQYLGCFCDDVCKEVMCGSHVPPEMRMKLSKLLSIDNIPEEFKAKGYKPHKMADFKSEVYEKVKREFEPHVSPLLAEESVIRLLPKTYILTCEFDVLRDEGLLYKRRLEENGIPVTWYHVKDGSHGVMSFFDRPNCSSGKLALDNVITFIKNL